MLNKKYNFFLFDLDRTLWDFDENSKRAIFHLIDIFSLPITDKELFFSKYEEINHRLWKSYEDGIITKDILRGARFYETLLLYNIDDRELSEKLGKAYLEQMILEKALIPGAYELLTRLKEDGCKMAIITNGFKEVQYHKLRNSDIIDFFDAIIISEEVGIHKPSPLIFKRALEAIGGIKAETLMVGDDFANDIEGAQIYGIDQFYYNPKHTECDGGPTYQSDNLLNIIDNGS